MNTIYIIRKIYIMFINYYRLIVPHPPPISRKINDFFTSNEQEKVAWMANDKTQRGNLFVVCAFALFVRFCRSNRGRVCSWGVYVLIEARLGGSL